MHTVLLVVASILGPITIGGSADAHGVSAPASVDAKTAAPVVIPDTPPGRVLARFLEAFNSGNRDQLQAFIAGNYSKSALAERPAEARAANQSRFYADQGALEVVAIRAADARSIDALARGTKSGRQLLIRFELEAASNQVAEFGVEISDPTEEAEPAPAVLAAPRDAGAAKAAIEKLVDERAAAGSFSGTVLVERARRPLVAISKGYADRERKLPNGPDTKFNLGSINKLFTHVAIARLAQEGKLRLDDTIAALWPDYPNREIARKVTVRQLVDHKSGLGDFFGARFRAAPPARLRSLADFLPLFVDEPLLFEPGTSQRYSNAGFVVLGLLVERLTGKSYYDVVREWVYEPAGMRDSGSFFIDEVVSNRAVGYARSEPSGPMAPNVGSLPGRGSSAGGGYSTAPDLARFAHALLDHRLLSPGWTAWVFGAAEPAQASQEAPRSLARGWAGGSDGVNAILLIGAAPESVVVVLANQDPPAAESFAKPIRELLGQILTPPPAKGN